MAEFVTSARGLVEAQLRRVGLHRGVFLDAKAGALEGKQTAPELGAESLKSRAVERVHNRLSD